MRKLFFGLVLLGGVGCMNAQPVGPMAKVMKPKGPPAAAAKANAPDPVTVPAPRPAPPAMLITEAEVSPDNPAVAAQKLQNEFEYDRRTINATKTAEVSVYKGGVKQN